MARSQQSRGESPTSVHRASDKSDAPEPQPLSELSPVGAGDNLEDLGGGVYALGGADAGVDAGIDGGTGPPDAGFDAGPDADPGPDGALPALAERGGCSAAGRAPLDATACALLFFAGLLWRRRE